MSRSSGWKGSSSGGREIGGAIRGALCLILHFFLFSWLICSNGGEGRCSRNDFTIRCQSMLKALLVESAKSKRPAFVDFNPNESIDHSLGCAHMSSFREGACKEQQSFSSGYICLDLGRTVLTLRMKAQQNTRGNFLVL